MGDQDEAKVAYLPGAQPLPENLIQVEYKDRYSLCRHERITLDHHARLVNCRDCGKVIDPFDFLHKQADLLARAWANHDSAQRKVSELSDKIGGMTKELERLRGKVSRAREKQPVIDVRGKDRL